MKMRENDVALRGHTFTLPGALRALAGRRPDHPCVTFMDSTITFAQLESRSNRVGNALMARGVQPGERIVVLAHNAPVFYELLFGCAKVGAVMVGLNWRLSQSEIATLVGDAQPRVVLVDEELRGLLPAFGADSDVYVLDSGAGYEHWRDSSADWTPAYDVRGDEVVLQVYTSGTTGVPMGALVTSENLSYTGKMAREFWSFLPDSVNLVAMPLFHIGGIGYSMTAMLQGGHTVLLRLPDPKEIITAIEKYRVTHSFLVPTVIQSIVDSDIVQRADLSSLQLMVYGAAPISETALLRAIATLGCKFTQAYGAAETTGTVISLLPPDHDPGGPRAYLLRSIGRPWPWVEARLVDPVNDTDVATGVVGELWVRTKAATTGYWNRPTETAKAITPEGWLRTGDAAYQDADGYFYLHDRYKDMIVSGAENVYPAEVENVLYSHPGVREVAVIGVPDDHWGEVVKAIVVRTPESNVSESELIQFCRQHLGKFKCPSSVDFIDVLPRNPSGKVLKTTLRVPYWRGKTRLIH
jgi:long-chain acyl-CoA synthetase